MVHRNSLFVLNYDKKEITYANDIKEHSDHKMYFCPLGENRYRLWIATKMRMINNGLEEREVSEDFINKLRHEE